ncbi:3-hydroxyacyl-CoA dehydrogenase NAD-binding domain-containing protein [Actinoplanes sp. NPDC020271]|uniref:3-hydroxyacyl-CoA dehydrogenase NAD-binding domain-containing protein n=1 Tax=Actinoplanes sp. NPDC020271 TaxID=3363896 RepID=UPI0037AB98A0
MGRRDGHRGVRVLGAGMTGAGIADVRARAGLDVVLRMSRRKRPGEPAARYSDRFTPPPLLLEKAEEGSLFR